MIKSSIFRKPGRRHVAIDGVFEATLHCETFLPQPVRTACSFGAQPRRMGSARKQHCSGCLYADAHALVTPLNGTFLVTLNRFTQQPSSNYVSETATICFVGATQDAASIGTMVATQPVAPMKWVCKSHTTVDLASFLPTQYAHALVIRQRPSWHVSLFEVSASSVFFSRGRACCAHQAFWAPLGGEFLLTSKFATPRLTRARRSRSQARFTCKPHRCCRIETTTWKIFAGVCGFFFW